MREVMHRDRRAARVEVMGDGNGDAMAVVTNEARRPKRRKEAAFKVRHQFNIGK